MTAPSATPSAPPSGPSPSTTSSGTISTVFAAVAAVGTLLVGVAAFIKDDKPKPETSTVPGVCSVAAANGASSGGNITGGRDVNVTVFCPVERDDALAEPEVVEKSMARPVDPEPPGPWAFTVLYDDGEGLFMRTTPDKAGKRIGYAVSAAVVHVECYKRSDYEPEPGRQFGKTWYKVHWPTATPAANQEAPPAMTSSPGDPAQAWAWGFYLRPNGHNGKIPACT